MADLAVSTWVGSPSLLLCRSLAQSAHCWRWSPPPRALLLPVNVVWKNLQRLSIHAKRLYHRHTHTNTPVHLCECVLAVVLARTSIKLEIPRTHTHTHRHLHKWGRRRHWCIINIHLSIHISIHIFTCFFLVQSCADSVMKCVQQQQQQQSTNNLSLSLPKR